MNTNKIDMKSRTYALALLGLLSLSACTPKAGDSSDNGGNADPAKTEAAAPAAKPSLVCREIRSTDDIAPRAVVYLSVGGEEVLVDSTTVCGDIDPGSYANYNIPASAVMAVGGWWAGAGDYYYLSVEGTEAVVYYGWADEGSEEDPYQYEEKLRAKL